MSKQKSCQVEALDTACYDVAGSRGCGDAALNASSSRTLFIDDHARADGLYTLEQPMSKGQTKQNTNITKKAKPHSYLPNIAPSLGV